MSKKKKVKEGRYLKSLSPMSKVAPYIMVTRNDALNYIEDSFDCENAEDYIFRKRSEGLKGFGMMHLLVAAYIRTVSQRPGINRFIRGQKIYARNCIEIMITIKREMKLNSPDTVLKMVFKPDATADDVYNTMTEMINNARNTDSDFDDTAKILNYIPGVFLKFTVWLLKTLDYFGMLPKFLLEVSPFHGSLFFTSMGSLGIPPIYHHLYDVGNLPVFGSFGMKRRAVEVQEDGSVVEKKYVDVKFTMDERIVDGFYYAAFFKHYRRILALPEILDNPPEEVLSDID